MAQSIERQKRRSARAHPISGANRKANKGIDALNWLLLCLNVLVFNC